MAEDAKMQDIESFDDGMAGLDVGEVHSLARRQLVGSLVAAAMIAVAVGVTMLRPVATDTAAMTPHRVAVQQPSFVTPSEHLLATRTQHEIELP